MNEVINTHIKNMNLSFNNPEGSALCEENGYVKETILDQALNLYDELVELEEEGFALKRQNDVNIQKQGRLGEVDAVGDLVVFHVGLSVLLNKYITIDKVVNLPTDDKSVIELFKIAIDDIVQNINDKVELDVLIETMTDFSIILNSYCVASNIDLNAVIEEVVKSNFTKLCKTQQQLDDTVKFYSDLGVETYVRESMIPQEDGTIQYIVFSSKEQEDVNKKMYRANKFLKCIDWKEPDLSFAL